MDREVREKASSGKQPSSTRPLHNLFVVWSMDIRVWSAPRLTKPIQKDFASVTISVYYIQALEHHPFESKDPNNGSSLIGYYEDVSTLIQMILS